MPLLLNNFLLRKNFHLQTIPNNKAETEEKIFYCTNAECENAFGLRHLL